MWRHKLGTPASEDVLVSSEPDEAYNMFVYRSRSSNYIFVGASSSITSDIKVGRG